MADSNAINVAKYVVQNTPIGHIQESVENLNHILGEEIMDNAAITSELASYEEDHLKQISYKNTKILLSKSTKDQEDNYYDQTVQLKFKVKPLANEIESSEPLDPPSSMQKTLDTKLKASKAKYFKEGITGTNVLEQTPEKWVLIISAHNINKKNCWSGEWLSQWELEKEGAKYNLKGNIKANTFYYEEGNIQFHLNTNFTEVIKDGSEESIAADVIAKIEADENKVQTELDNVYENFSDQYIKPLRRKLPITGTKMNWNLNQVQFTK